MENKEVQKPTESGNSKSLTIHTDKPSNFKDIFESQLPNFQKIIKYGSGTEAECLIAQITNDFLVTYSTGEQQATTSVQFAKDILNTRPDWKIADVDMLFTFIRTRQDLPECRIFGNKITGIKLMELVAVYEAERADELVKYHKSKSLNTFIDAFVGCDNVNEHFKKIMDMCRPTPKEHTATRVDDRVKRAMDDFDRMYDESNQLGGGIRTILVCGKRMDLDQYLNYRLNDKP